ncbi:16S rRNA (uracil(1498)-N(3))-methyltransferase [Pseudomonadales bacterium]|nr:16S rRNA (uracil(1498)-N(3))-methyltransferase [Pseudomonadales bacterium]MDB2647410.1 16S rRNA (uracil(1498)-N(3))-methyltransferase [Pseudomonadales bacterium]
MPRFSLFYLQGPHTVGAKIQLNSERSNYLCRALRLNIGDEINIFDGTGALFTAAIRRANPRSTEVEITAAEQPAHASIYSLTLAIGLIKGSAMDRALQQATELGANKILLIQADRSNVPLKSDRMENKIGHWERVISASCEQCGQLYLPELVGPQTLEEAIKQTENGMVFSPLGESFPAQMQPVNRTAFVGPEGGWSDKELDLFQQRQIPSYKLGRTILRAETMPSVALGLIQQAQGWH